MTGLGRDLATIENQTFDLAVIGEELHDEGVKKFAEPFDHLLANITEKARGF